MSINRFSRSAPMEWKLPKTPLEPLAYALEQKQKRFDIGYQLADELADQQIQALQQDRARANELVRGWNEQIDNMVTKYDGDYSRMYKDLGSLKRDISRTMKAGGEGNAIQTNYANYYNWLKGEQDRLKKGEIIQAQLQHGADYYLRNYQGVGQQDPVTGNFNLFQPESLAKYTNPDDFLHEALKNVAADEGGSLVARPDGFYIKTSGGKYEKIDQERIQNIAAQTLMNNPEYVNMMHQLGNHMGVDPAQMIQQDIAERAVRMGNIYRKDNRWYESDLKGNPIAVKMWEMQQMTKPAPGQTMPGNIENTKLSGLKLDIGSSGYFKSSGTGQEPLAGTGLQYVRKDQTEHTADNLISKTQGKLAKEAPALVDAFNATVSEVQSSPKYKAASERQKQELLQEAWNKKIDKVQTVSVSDVVFPEPVLRDIEFQWKKGIARGAKYQKVQKDGSLGKVIEFGDFDVKEQEEILSSPPVGLTPHSEKSGAKMYLSDGEYVVTDTNLDDLANIYLRPIAQMRMPLTEGKIGNIPWGPKDYPVIENGEWGSRRAPEGSTISFMYDKDMNRIGKVKDRNGKVIDIIPPEGVNLIEGGATRGAAAAIPQSSRYSSKFLQWGDGEYDN